MFLNIFKNEISYWLDRPAFYVYSLIFLFIAVMTSGSAAGLFDSVTVTVGSSRIVNSPFALSGLFAGLSTLVVFLYPSIIGVSVYRDFKSEMHFIFLPFYKVGVFTCKIFQRNIYSSHNCIVDCIRNWTWI